MADTLYLSLWFRGFRREEILARVACVLGHFPFSAQRTGIGHVSVHSLSWSEPSVFEETFDERGEPARVLALAEEFLHDDNGYTFEAAWDLWSPGEQEEKWLLRPHPVKIIAHGEQFEEGAYEQSGHIQIELGLDSNFLLEGAELTSEAQQCLKQNLEQLLAFSKVLQKNCAVSSRLLWSEAEENLAQKLLTRLQRLN